MVESFWKRSALRVTILAFLLFIALSVPTFGNIMDLVGASSITIVSLVMPAFMYTLVAKRSKYDDMTNSVPLIPSKNAGCVSYFARKIVWVEKCYCYFLITFGVLGATASTYTAVENLIVTRFQLPCYL